MTEHADGRLRHIAPAGALQPSPPDVVLPVCHLPERDYAFTETACPDCQGLMQHHLHRDVEWHFDHACRCGTKFRDLGAYQPRVSPPPGGKPNGRRR
ncbi:MAG: hypothetical protein ACRDRD_17165 [Pseudonocardiaceae bacterium]